MTRRAELYQKTLYLARTQSKNGDRTQIPVLHVFLSEFGDLLELNFTSVLVLICVSHLRARSDVTNFRLGIRW